MHYWLHSICPECHTAQASIMTFLKVVLGLHVNLDRLQCCYEVLLSRGSPIYIRLLLGSQFKLNSLQNLTINQTHEPFWKVSQGSVLGIG